LPGCDSILGFVQHLRRIIRSLAVSGVTSVLSLAILAGLTRFEVTSPAKANVISGLAGVGPSFALNRRWAWKRSGRGHVAREVLPFWIYALVSLVLSTIAVDRAGAWADAVALPPGRRTFVVLFANVATYGALWIGQYLLLDRVLFRDRVHPGELVTTSG
jgi:putative flippase GtrA